MKDLTVKELAKASGVSVRTLHFYDEIGLLKPARVGANAYRYYTRVEMLRLQQILFYREFGIPLQEVGALLARPREEQATLLASHRDRIAAEARRKREIVRTIDRTIAEIRGERIMQNSELYRGLRPEKQEEYEAWLTGRYGPDMEADIERSRAHLGGAPSPERMQELHDVEQAIADAMRAGTPADASELLPLIERHREWVASMWGKECSPEAHAGLAGLYEAHPDFRARYETIEPGFTDYLVAAMRRAARAKA
jgi:DNA-binding transcriptional MerR regulator